MLKDLSESLTQILTGPPFSPAGPGGPWGPLRPVRPMGPPGPAAPLSPGEPCHQRTKTHQSSLRYVEVEKFHLHFHYLLHVARPL